jgi:hypothetical protein
MWAHFLLLLSPNRENHLALVITSQERYRSATEALKNSKFVRDYQDWHLVSFATAYKADRTSPTQKVEVQIPERGSLVCLEV